MRSSENAKIGWQNDRRKMFTQSITDCAKLVSAKAFYYLLFIIIRGACIFDQNSP